MLCTFFIFPMRATCAIHIMLLNSVILTIQQYKFCNSSLNIFFRPSITAFLLDNERKYDERDHQGLYKP
jgi:hypothetical protein